MSNIEVTPLSPRLIETTLPALSLKLPYPPSKDFQILPGLFSSTVETRKSTLSPLQLDGEGMSARRVPPTHTPNDPSMLEGNTKRVNPLTDLVETETIFVVQLTGIIRKVAGAWSLSNYPPQEVDTMFRNIEGVYRAHRAFHAKLKDINAAPISAIEVGRLLIKWIDDLKKPYENYFSKFCSGFDVWEPVKSNARLGPILVQFSAMNPPPSNTGVWTLDSLFLLPKLQLKKYLKLYNRLLSTMDNQLLVSAVETLNSLMHTIEGRNLVKVGGHNRTFPAIETEDKAGVGFRLNHPLSHLLPPAAEVLRCDEVGTNIGSKRSPTDASILTGSSQVLKATVLSRKSTQALSIPISDLARRLAARHREEASTKHEQYFRRRVAEAIKLEEMVMWKESVVRLREEVTLKREKALLEWEEQLKRTDQELRVWAIMSEQGARETQFRLLEEREAEVHRCEEALSVRETEIQRREEEVRRREEEEEMVREEALYMMVEARLREAEATEKEANVKQREKEATKREEAAINFISDIVSRMERLKEEVSRKDIELQMKDDVTKRLQEMLVHELNINKQVQQSAQGQFDNIQAWFEGRKETHVGVARVAANSWKTEDGAKRKEIQVWQKGESARQQQKRPEMKYRETKQFQHKKKKATEEVTQDHNELLQFEELVRGRERKIQEREYASRLDFMHLDVDASPAALQRQMAVTSTSASLRRMSSTSSSVISVEDREQFYQEQLSQQHHSGGSEQTRPLSMRSSDFSVEDHEEYYQQQRQGAPESS